MGACSCSSTVPGSLAKWPPPMVPWETCLPTADLQGAVRCNWSFVSHMRPYTALFDGSGNPQQFFVVGGSMQICPSIWMTCMAYGFGVRENSKIQFLRHQVSPSIDNSQYAARIWCSSYRMVIPLGACFITIQNSVPLRNWCAAGLVLKDPPDLDEDNV